MRTLLVRSTLALFVASMVFIGTHQAQDVSAGHQFLTFVDKGTPAEFGANEAVVIDGTISYESSCATGIGDFFYPIADVYVVPSGFTGTALSDVSGTPNTFIGFSGGVFISELIAYTAPGGNLGSGTYAIIFDECQNEVFDGHDFILDPAFTVKIPVYAPSPPLGTILAAKNRAELQKDHWEKVRFSYKWLFKFADSVDGPSKKDIADKIEGFAEKFASQLGGADIKKGTANTILAVRDHYKGIEADPPDYNFEQVVTLEPREPLDPQTNDLLVVAGALGGEAAGGMRQPSPRHC